MLADAIGLRVRGHELLNLVHSVLFTSVTLADLSLIYPLSRIRYWTRCISPADILVEK